jgi:hypothetical protein
MPQREHFLGSGEERRREDLSPDLLERMNPRSRSASRASKNVGVRSGTFRRFTFVTGFGPLYLPASSAALNALCKKPRKLFRLFGLSCCFLLWRNVSTSPLVSRCRCFCQRGAEEMALHRGLVPPV